MHGEGSLCQQCHILNINEPTSCIRGEYIYVNLVASINFNAGGYDPAIYTATSPCRGGNANNNCGILGRTCAVDVLGKKDRLQAPLELDSIAMI